MYEKEELVKRLYTQEGIDPLESIVYEKRNSKILGRDGNVKFELKDVEVPLFWSQMATDVITEKYMMKKGVPNTGREIGAKQVVHRISHTIRTRGEEMGYFASKDEAETFEAELSHMMINQIGAFNSPVWFNVGHFHEYGIQGDGKHNYHYDHKTNTIEKVANTYEFPQCSACFIQSVPDDLEGMMDLQKSEVMLFKGGSGTGTNFSKIRGAGEKLSSGGKSSGLLSFLRGYDAWAGVIKSGGTTRRAAKMVIVDIDHPEIEEFINLKSKEENVIRALVNQGYSTDFEGEAYQHAWGQNANNSVRVSDKFMQAVVNNGKWPTIERKSGKISKEYDAQYLWELICKSAWGSGDPGLQFDTTINKWHTCKESGRINASNPCSEYMFLDDSACNLASLNLMKFLNEDGSFDSEKFVHASKTFLLAQEIIVDMSSYPSQKIAENSHNYRALGLGFANLGTLLMTLGLPYDSEEGRAVAAGVCALMTGAAYTQSAKIAERKGPFPGYEKNKETMLNVIGLHQDVLKDITSVKGLESLLQNVKKSWDEAVELGRKYGYRNSQTTLLAPTGTIGFIMDCDTTGIEPDYSLVKTKKLAGGGHVYILNQNVPNALHKLGYSKKQREEILNYIFGKMSFSSKELSNEFNLLVSEAGLSDEDARKAIEYVSNMKHWSDLTPGVSPKLLKEKSIDDQRVKNLEIAVNGHGFVEGAPGLKEEHYAVFDCADPAGGSKRFIAPMGHVKMLAACQPYLSGAISKTVNMPEDSTEKDISNTYFEAWKLGVKSIALYRNNSKVAQPLSSGNDSGKKDNKLETENNIESKLAWGEKKILEYHCDSLRFKAKIAGHTIYGHTGEYSDGRVGEIFIDMFKEGSDFKSALHAWSVGISKAFQHGMSVDEFVDTYLHYNCEPKGFIDHPYIKNCSSIYDFVAKVLAVEYLGRTELTQEEIDPKKLRVNKLKLMQQLGKDQKSQSILPEDKDESKQKSNEQKQKLEEIAGGPPCPTCGFSTIRNGACYKCPNCGISLGCS